MCKPEDLDEPEHHSQDGDHDETDSESDSEASADEEDHYVTEWHKVFTKHQRGDKDGALEVALRLLRRYKTLCIKRSMTIKRLRSQRHRR